MSDVTDRPDRTRPAGSGGRLPCGVLVGDLLEQVAYAAGDRTATGTDTQPAGGLDGRTLDHQRRCPHCRAMLAELREVWAPVTALAAQPVRAPDSLSRTVMERVSALAAHGWHAIVDDDPGRTRIGAWVIAVVARRAAASVTGVDTVQGRVLPTDLAVASVQARYVATPTATQQRMAAGVGVAGRTVVVRVEITAADVTASLPRLGEQVRRAVITHVQALTGLVVVEVDVHVSGFEAASAQDPLPIS